MLTSSELNEYRECGHLTVSGVFAEAEVLAVLDDLQAWSRQAIDAMNEHERAWFLENQGASDGAQPRLRKLDHPVFYRPMFRKLATSLQLVGMVEQLIGEDVQVFFSQMFFKSPEHGGPKPIHQDNFYFGPSDEDATVTAWIALDEATVENGCLFYGNGSHVGPLLQHVAPENEPFNLQVPPEVARRYQMTPAPVPRGGVSFHHGRTLHQSSPNRSNSWRRAAAVHFMRNDAYLETPALKYDARFTIKCNVATTI